MKYHPKPIDTTEVKLPDEIMELTEMLAENAHEIWAKQRVSQGWIYGEERNDKKKQHPCLIPYKELPESEKRIRPKRRNGNIEANFIAGV